MNFIEDASISGVRRTSDGYLVGQVACARTGIQHYAGDEVGKPELGLVAVYRPESEVFGKDSLASIAGKPLTNNHPPVQVDSKNWKEFSVGSVGNEILRDGEKISIPIMLMDEKAIADVEGGKRELSNGYTMDLVWQDGVAPCGTPYQAIQTNIRMNHVAIVDRGRAGHECRIGDGAAKTWGARPTNPLKEVKTMSDKALRTVVVDGLSVETTDQGAQAIAKLQSDLNDANELISSVDSDHKKALEAKDKELATKDAEIDSLKAKQLSDSDLDKLVNDRAKLVADAQTLDDEADFSGMSANDIRKAAVIKVRGADAVEGKSQAYIDAAFDLALDAVKDQKPDPVRDALKHKAPKTVQDNGQGDYEKRLRDAHLTAGGI